MLLCCVLALGYFVAQGLQNRYGLETRAKLSERSVALSRELARLETVRTELERETQKLAAEPPDLDLLDEHARRVLGFVHSADRRIVTRSD